MQIKLIDYTGAGEFDAARYAAERLVFTKQTRLTMSADTLANVTKMSDEALMGELEYMANTIPSSWEFIDYTFLINGVSRAFTHQFVRTRTGSYAQQTMRVLDMQEWDYVTGPSIAEDPMRCEFYSNAMKVVDDTYRDLIDMGAKIEDARGVLPTNICTNLVAKFNLRTLADTMRKRASSRTQGEYRDVLEGMKAEVIRVHPWASLFFNRTFDVAAHELEARITENMPDNSERIHMLKLLDQMRMTA
jgi:thymidylate synthase (FAD)